MGDIFDFLARPSVDKSLKRHLATKTNFLAVSSSSCIKKNAFFRLQNVDVGIKDVASTQTGVRER